MWRVGDSYRVGDGLVVLFTNNGQDALTVRMKGKSFSTSVRNKVYAVLDGLNIAESATTLDEQANLESLADY